MARKYTPTFSEILEIYPIIATAERMKCESPCQSTVWNVVTGVRQICRSLGVSLESPLTDLTRPMLDRYLADAIKRGHSPTTAWTYLHHLQGISARWTLPYYQDRGWLVKSFDLPVCRRTAARYIRPDRSVLLKVKNWYESLWIREDKRDWIAVTLMLEFAMRNGDAGRLRWGDFRQRDGNVYLCYTPHKTALTSGRIVAWPVHEKIWNHLCVCQKVSGADKHNLKDIVLPGACEVFRRLNSELRSIKLFLGVKGLYELRKICIDHIYQKFGAEMASSISGDDIRTVTRYYADPSAVNVTGVRIVDLL